MKINPKNNIVNSKPQKFENVKVYAGDPWSPPVDGKIRKLSIETKGIMFHDLS